jgi:hypothetical protein
MCSKEKVVKFDETSIDEVGSVFNDKAGWAVRSVSRQLGRLVRLGVG